MLTESSFIDTGSVCWRQAPKPPVLTGLQADQIMLQQTELKSRNGQKRVAVGSGFSTRQTGCGARKRETDNEDETNRDHLRKGSPSATSFRTTVSWKCIGYVVR